MKIRVKPLLTQSFWESVLVVEKSSVIGGPEGLFETGSALFANLCKPLGKSASGTLPGFSSGSHSTEFS
jgi:hypothetical protein